MSHDHMKEDIKDRIDCKEAAALQCMDICRKANTAFLEEDFKLFTKSELLQIAELSANKATVLRRELHEYHTELAELIDYINDLENARCAQKD